MPTRARSMTMSSHALRFFTEYNFRNEFALVAEASRPGSTRTRIENHSSAACALPPNVRRTSTAPRRSAIGCAACSPSHSAGGRGIQPVSGGEPHALTPGADQELAGGIQSRFNAPTGRIGDRSSDRPLIGSRAADPAFKNNPMNSHHHTDEQTDARSLALPDHSPPPGASEIAPVDPSGRPLFSLGTTRLRRWNRRSRSWRAR
jgi:hypothetical protein